MAGRGRTLSGIGEVGEGGRRPPRIAPPSPRLLASPNRWPIAPLTSTGPTPCMDRCSAQSWRSSAAGRKFNVVLMGNHRTNGM